MINITHYRCFCLGLFKKYALSMGFIDTMIRAYCIFAKLTNSNVLGKLAIRDLNNWVNWKLLLVDLAKIQ
jgi:hypothetical protein